MPIELGERAELLSMYDLSMPLVCRRESRCAKSNACRRMPTAVGRSHTAAAIEGNDIAHTL